MKRKLVWALVALTLIGIFAFAWAPYGLKSYVQKTYPGVRVQNVFLRWSFVGFEGVQVDRPGIKGTLASVYVPWKTPDDVRGVWVYGGKLDVDLSMADQSSVSQRSKVNLQGTGLTVNVTKPGFTAQLKGVSFDSKGVHFKSGTATYKGYTPTITEGHFNRVTKRFKAKHLEVPFEVPFEIPKIDKNQVVKFEKVEVTLEPLNLTFEAASLDPFFKVSAKSEIDPIPDRGMNLELNELEVNHPWIAPDPVLFHKIEATVTPEKRVVFKINGKAFIDINAGSFSVDGSEECNTWVDAMPEPLPEALKQAKGHFSGTLSFDVQRDPTPRLNLKNKCKFDCSTPLGKSLRGRLTYMAYDKDNKLFERTVGSGTKDWVAFGELPPHVPKAFITLEDPGFLGHRGIIPQALENSFKDNLKLGKFFRGGSTISMQLAKNLWLRRHKTIGRKVQEAFLTIVLESCLSKTEILELYTNVVEFGPNLYGIGPATKFYFDKEPGELEPEEAFYLASVLPRPRKAIPPASGGLKRIRGLMQVLASRGFIPETLVPVSDDEIDASGWETE